jgi:hypothetical protein
MGYKKVVMLFFIGILFFSFLIPCYPETKKEYQEQLTKSRKDFIAQRDKLHDQNRVLRIAWHKERERLYKEIKANPKDKTLKQKLNAGASKFFADKKSIYSQLEQLRKDWFKIRRDLGAKIKNA